MSNLTKSHNHNHNHTRPRSRPGPRSAGTTAATKRKVASIVTVRPLSSLPRDEDDDLTDEYASFKRLKKAGIEVAKVQSNRLLDLLVHPTLTIEEFRAASAFFGPTHLDPIWCEVVEHVDCSLLLERLKEFLTMNNECRPEKAINILSRWECLVFPEHWKAHKDLIKLLVSFVKESFSLLQAITQVRDDKKCRNHAFFSLLIRHAISLGKFDFAEEQESLVTAEWSTGGDMEAADRIDAEYDRLDEEEEDSEEEEEEEEEYVEVYEAVDTATDTASEYSDHGDDDDDDDYGTGVSQCHAKRDLMQWRRDRTEAAASASACGSENHRCSVDEARRDYEEWVGRSAFPRKRIGKQEFVRYLERDHQVVADNGRQFFIGLVLKSARNNKSLGKYF